MANRFCVSLTHAKNDQDKATVAFVVANAAVGSGNPGGAFTPTLLLGGCTGALYAAGLNALGVAISSPSSYALVGVAVIASSAHIDPTCTIAPPPPCSTIARAAACDA